MTVGLVGLGLIGGSVARAYKADKDTSHTVLAFDKNTQVFESAEKVHAVDGELSLKNIGECKLIFLCLYPDASVEYLKKAAPHISKSAVVIDCCGTKRKICSAGFKLAEEFGFTFVGGHPMAGTHNSGFKYSRSDMFRGAPMVIVPPKEDQELVKKTERLLSPLGIGMISVTSAEEHDKMIAFTSQMAHIVSNAYVKSPEAKRHKGFSAGSYKDLTRVAWLNPDMWTELFLENGDNLISELDIIIDNLAQYREAIINADSEKLWQLLEDGRRIKGDIDG